MRIRKEGGWGCKNTSIMDFEDLRPFPALHFFSGPVLAFVADTFRGGTSIRLEEEKRAYKLQQTSPIHQ
jgi:hypothetical protein